MTITISKLNDLTIATDNINSVESVTIQILVNVGSRDETKAQNGISHFIEHMAFKGTDKRNAKEIAESFDNIGGVFNAYTSRDKTVFYAKILKEDIEIAFDILSDIVQNSVFAPEEIEKERDVILQEIASTNDTPDDIIFDHFQEALFPNQQFGRSILGSKSNVSGFTRENIADYFHDYYHTGNVVICAAGNASHKAIEDLTKKYFTNIKTKNPSKRELPKYQANKKFFSKDLEQTHFIIGYEGISKKSDDYYTIQAISSILGGGMSSRLFQKVREQNGLCYSIYAFAQGYQDTGSFAIYTATDPASSGKAFTLIHQEIEKFIANVTEEEIKKAVKCYKASLMMGLENTNVRARRLGYDVIDHGKNIKHSEILKRLEVIDKYKIKLLSEKIFNSPESLVAIGKTETLKNLS